MTIKVEKYSVDPDNLSTLFGVDGSLIDSVIQAGFSIKVTSTSIVAQSPSGNSDSVTFKKGAIALAQKGVLSGAATQAIGFKIEQFLKSVLVVGTVKEVKIPLPKMSHEEIKESVLETMSPEQAEAIELMAGDSDEEPFKKAMKAKKKAAKKAKIKFTANLAIAQQWKALVIKTVQTNGKVAGIKLLRQKSGWGLKEAKDLVEVWMGELPEETLSAKVKVQKIPISKEVKELFNQEPVNLRAATELYQPVRSSSNGSIYHCVAIGSALRIAARYKGVTVSIRVEGESQEDLDKYKNELVSLGFNNDYFIKGYTSCHTQVEDDQMAQKVLGALIMGIGAEFDTKVPLVNKFKDYGK